jgi:hypothetical protein
VVRETNVKKQYRVLLPVTIGAITYGYGETVSLDADAAQTYAHALAAVSQRELDEAQLAADQAKLAADEKKLKK